MNRRSRLSVISKVCRATCATRHAKFSGLRPVSVEKAWERRLFSSGVRRIDDSGSRAAGDGHVQSIIGIDPKWWWQKIAGSNALAHFATCRIARWQGPALSLCLLLFLVAGQAVAGGGPLGIDHVVAYQNSGIWKRSNQTALLDLLIGGEIAGALWEGGETRLGKTFWQSIDASVIGAVSSEAMKHIFTRSRPDQSSDPNLWFQGSSHYSFPSGEVTAVTAIVTPFVLEYAHDFRLFMRWSCSLSTMGSRE
jgi:membrane-associated phospholipid phosphatase